MEYLININMMAVKRQEAENNIHVLKEVFEIIKFLGRQNLPFRVSASSAWKMMENIKNDIKQI